MTAMRAARSRQIVVVGYGSAGRRHCENLRALGHHDIVVVRRHESSTSPKDIEVSTDYDAVLARRPLAVLVASPTSKHVEIARKAVDAGCHVFLEKPVSHSDAGLDELEAAAAKRGVIVAVGYQLRFHPGLKKTCALLRDGAIGRVLSARVQVGSYLPDWHPDEDYSRGCSALVSMGGGVLRDLSHEIDYALWLFGPARSVQSMVLHCSDLNIETEDLAVILLECARAPLVEIHLDYLQRVATRTCTVIGSHGSLLWDYFSAELRVARAEPGRDIVETEPDWNRNDMFLAELKDFLDAVGQDRPPAVGLREGREALRVVEAAERATANGARIVLEDPR